MIFLLLQCCNLKVEQVSVKLTITRRWIPVVITQYLYTCRRLITQDAEQGDNVNSVAVAYLHAPYHSLVVFMEVS